MRSSSGQEPIICAGHRRRGAMAQGWPSPFACEAVEMKCQHRSLMARLSPNISLGTKAAPHCCRCECFGVYVACSPAARGSDMVQGNRLGNSSGNRTDQQASVGAAALQALLSALASAEPACRSTTANNAPRAHAGPGSAHWGVFPPVSP
eukprot:363127-Chlamydomonas_euryale.AAC.10